MIKLYRITEIIASIFIIILTVKILVLKTTSIVELFAISNLFTIAMGCMILTHITAKEDE